MGHRLSRIYTRTGDRGTTGLADGDRIAKTHPRIDLMGGIDELNSLVGVVLAHTPPSGGEATETTAIMTRLQHELFEIGAECARAPARLDDSWVTRLERDLDHLNEALPPLQEFLLPGGSPAAAFCHLARAVCRRVERQAWHLASSEALNPALLQYLNRLSDLLFVIARVLARREGGREILWNPRPAEPRPEDPGKEP